MERRPASARRALAAAALLLVVGLAACSDSDRAVRRTAATVGEVEITQAEVLDLMAGQLRFAELSTAAAEKAAEASADDPTLQSQAQEASSAADELVDRYGGTGAEAGVDSFGTAGAAEVLTTAIEAELFREAARQADVEVAASAVRDARAALVENLKTRGVTSTKGLEPLLDLYGELQAYQTALTQAFATTGAEREAQLQAAFAEALPQQSQYCLNLISTADEASAQAAYARVQAGEDFLAVGNEVSVDKDTLAEGQELCITGAQLFEVFTDVPTPIAAGTVLAPVDGQGSWFFVRVVSAQEPTFEQVRPQLEQSTPDAAATTRLEEAIADAQERLDVTVDPRFGTWNAETRVVEPPDPEPSGTTSTSTTLPAATDPAATDPAATDPAATDPAATDPAATDPAATDPAGS